MRGTWIRRLIPASVVGIVLALSYFAPAEGMFAPPVKDLAAMRFHDLLDNCEP